jgi:hypothetical protein
LIVVSAPDASGMVTVTEFVRAVVPWGTTGMFVDPHEIANVFGLKGVRLMVDEAQVQPIHVWVQVPSCVPSAPGLETAGATITPDDVAEAMQWEGIIGLGEMMNFPGVFNGDSKMLDEMAATAAAGMIKDLVEAVILGQDPFPVEALWSRMYDDSFWAKGGGPIVFAGMSAVEQALWHAGRAFGHLHEMFVC